MPEAHSVPDALDHDLSDDTAKIIEEHRVLKEVLGKLEATRDVSEIISLLDHLADLLATHFEREERADGILRDVRAHNPNRVDQMAAILAEHDGLLASCKQLATDARACLDGPVAKLYEGVRELGHHLHDHEARESEIFLDAIYTDIGTAD